MSTALLAPTHITSVPPGVAPRESFASIVGVGVRRVTWEGAGEGPGVYLARFEAPGIARTLRLIRVE